MLNSPRFSVQDALDIMSAGTPPLDFGSGLAVYRAALRGIAKVSVPGLITSDLKTVTLDRALLESLHVHLDQHPPNSTKERKRRKEWLSRIGTVARRLEGVPAAQTSPVWEAFLLTVRELAPAYALTDHDLIPITSTIRQVAVEDGLVPKDMTAEWLTARAQKAGSKRRDSLRRAAAILDKLWADIPSHIRSTQHFGPIERQSERRVSHPLPPRAAKQLEAYLAERVEGKMAQGLQSMLQVKEGIDSKESTNIYRQALGWIFDSLCFVNLVSPHDDLQISDLARLEWVSKVAVQGLADHAADAGAHVMPWKPIDPKTIYSRTTALIILFEGFCPDFSQQNVTLANPETLQSITVDAEGVQKLVRAHFDNGLTDAHKEFCRLLIADEDNQHLLLNMHLICWSEAQVRWRSYAEQSQRNRVHTINLCVLTAILAIVVHIPFRARTITEMVLEGEHPDLSLPKGGKRIEFNVARKRMKARNPFDAVLDDAPSRQILDWFIAGPRQELLRNQRFLLNPQRERLFCGIGTSRYNRLLVDWTEEVGMRMTTHLFRHALASILVNRCEASLEEVAGILGNTVATAERNYVFYDRIRQRGGTLQKLADRRKQLAETHHPNRRRKT